MDNIAEVLSSSSVLGAPPSRVVVDQNLRTVALPTGDRGHIEASVEQFRRREAPQSLDRAVEVQVQSTRGGSFATLG